MGGILGLDFVSGRSDGTVGRFSAVDIVEDFTVETRGPGLTEGDNANDPMASLMRALYTVKKPRKGCNGDRQDQENWLNYLSFNYCFMILGVIQEKN